MAPSWGASAPLDPASPRKPGAAAAAVVLWRRARPGGRGRPRGASAGQGDPLRLESTLGRLEDTASRGGGRHGERLMSVTHGTTRPGGATLPHADARGGAPGGSPGLPEALTGSARLRPSQREAGLRGGAPEPVHALRDAWHRGLRHPRGRALPGHRQPEGHVRHLQMDRRQVRGLPGLPHAPGAVLETLHHRETGESALHGRAPEVGGRGCARSFCGARGARPGTHPGARVPAPPKAGVRRCAHTRARAFPSRLSSVRPSSLNYNRARVSALEPSAMQKSSQSGPRPGTRETPGVGPCTQPRFRSGLRWASGCAPCGGGVEGWGNVPSQLPGVPGVPFPCPSPRSLTDHHTVAGDSHVCTSGPPGDKPVSKPTLPPRAGLANGDLLAGYLADDVLKVFMCSLFKNDNFTSKKNREIQKCTRKAVRPAT